MKPFITYPAIDLIDGQVVRLTEGDFNSQTTYHDNPVEMAQSFAQQGATYLHVVDLNGAKQGAPSQTTLIKKIVATSGLKVQVGGGVRNLHHVKELLEAGVDRVVIGSLAVKDPEAFKEIVKEVGADNITLGLDLRVIDGEPRVAISGWQQVSERRASEFLNSFREVGLEDMHILCTDISRDGKLAGVNLPLYKELKEELPQLKLLASGGIRNKEDVVGVREAGLAGVIIGKAIYEGGLKLPEVLDHD